MPKKSKRVTIKNINKEAEKYGLQLLKGNSYFYWMTAEFLEDLPFEEIEAWFNEKEMSTPYEIEETSVYTPRLGNDWDDWMDELQYVVGGMKAEYIQAQGRHKLGPDNTLRLGNKIGEKKMKTSKNRNKKATNIGLIMLDATDVFDGMGDLTDVQIEERLNIMMYDQARQQNTASKKTSTKKKAMSETDINYVIELAEDRAAYDEVELDVALRDIVEEYTKGMRNHIRAEPDEIYSEVTKFLQRGYNRKGLSNPFVNKKPKSYQGEIQVGDILKTIGKNSVPVMVVGVSGDDISTQDLEVLDSEATALDHTYDRNQLAPLNDNDKSQWSDLINVLEGDYRLVANKKKADNLPGIDPSPEYMTKMDYYEIDDGWRVVVMPFEDKGIVSSDWASFGKDMEDEYATAVWTQNPQEVDFVLKDNPIENKSLLENLMFTLRNHDLMPMLDMPQKKLLSYKKKASNLEIQVVDILNDRYLVNAPYSFETLNEMLEKWDAPQSESKVVQVVDVDKDTVLQAWGGGHDSGEPERIPLESSKKSKSIKGRREGEFGSRSDTPLEAIGMFSQEAWGHKKKIEYIEGDAFGGVAEFAFVDGTQTYTIAWDDGVNHFVIHRNTVESSKKKANDDRDALVARLKGEGRSNATSGQTHWNRIYFDWNSYGVNDITLELPNGEVKTFDFGFIGRVSGDWAEEAADWVIANMPVSANKKVTANIYKLPASYVKDVVDYYNKYNENPLSIGDAKEAISTIIDSNINSRYLTRDEIEEEMDLITRNPEDFMDVHDMFEEVEQLVQYGVTTWEASKKADDIPGGLADDLPDEDFDPEQLAKGIQVELEHTDDLGIAKEITKDHLMESDTYYDHLEDMEERMEASKKKAQKEYVKLNGDVTDRFTDEGAKAGEVGDVIAYDSKRDLYRVRFPADDVKSHRVLSIMRTDFDFVNQASKKSYQENYKAKILQHGNLVKNIDRSNENQWVRGIAGILVNGFLMDDDAMWDADYKDNKITGLYDGVSIELLIPDVGGRKLRETSHNETKHYMDWIGAEMSRMVDAIGNMEKMKLDKGSESSRKKLEYGNVMDYLKNIQRGQDVFLEAEGVPGRIDSVDQDRGIMYIDRFDGTISDYEMKDISDGLITLGKKKKDSGWVDDIFRDVDIPSHVVQEKSRLEREVVRLSDRFMDLGDLLTEAVDISKEVKDIVSTIAGARSGILYELNKVMSDYENLKRSYSKHKVADVGMEELGRNIQELTREWNSLDSQIGQKERELYNLESDRDRVVYDMKNLGEEMQHAEKEFDVDTSGLSFLPSRGWFAKVLKSGNAKGMPRIYQETLDDFKMWMGEIPEEQLDSMVSEKALELEILISDIKLAEAKLKDMKKQKKDKMGFFDKLSTALNKELIETESHLVKIKKWSQKKPLAWKSVALWVMEKLDEELRKEADDFVANLEVMEERVRVTPMMKSESESGVAFYVMQYLADKDKAGWKRNKIWSKACKHYSDKIAVEHIQDVFEKYYTNKKADSAWEKLKGYAQKVWDSGLGLINKMKVWNNELENLVFEEVYDD